MSESLVSDSLVQRYKLTVEYVGNAYHGSQRQPKRRTVQEELEAALAKLTHTAPPPTTFSGRTDAGVHAVGQVVHVDLARRSKHGEPLPPMEVPDLLNALNFFLPAGKCGVVSARTVPTTFDARRSAVVRTYVYRIRCGATSPPPAAVTAGGDCGNELLRADVASGVLRRRGWFSALEQQRALCLAEPLDLARMRAAAAVLLGKHDFSAFRSVRCGAASPVRELLELDVVDEAPGALEALQRECPRRLSVRVRGRSFLHHQVRYLVAALLEAGRANLDPPAVRHILETGDNKLAPPPAPAHGLYLAHVEYPPSAYEERPLALGEAGDASDEGEGGGEGEGGSEAGEDGEATDDEAAPTDDESGGAGGAAVDAACQGVGGGARAAQCTEVSCVGA